MINKLHLSIMCTLPSLLVIGCNSDTPGQEKLSTPTLDAVHERNSLNCGVRPTTSPYVGFADYDDTAELRYGFDIDFCKATAAAIFSDQSKVAYIGLSASERFSAVSDSRVDVLYRNTSYSVDRDNTLGVDFPGTSFFGGVGFLSTQPEIESIHSLTQPVNLCTYPEDPSQVGGTLPEYMVAGKEYLTNEGISFDEYKASTADEAYVWLTAGTCNLLSKTRAELAIINVNNFSAESFSILDEVTLLDPLGPVVKEGDEHWYMVIAAVLNALIRADELGIDSTNVESMLSSTDQQISDFLGQTGSLYADLGLPNGWVVDVVKAVGSYSEIYDRNFGSNPKIMLPPGKNDLVENGGLLDSAIIN